MPRQPDAHTNFRQLTAADVPLLRGLLQVFADAFDDHRSYLGSPPSDGYLRKLLSRPHFITLVAVRDGQVVGGLVAYELEKFEQERSEIYIYDLAVAEPYRRQGIARRLITDLQRIAGDRGAWVIYVQADYDDEPAIALYTSMGVREDVMHFDIPVVR